MLGIPLRGPIIPMGRIKISKKNPEKKLLYTCSKITDLYGNLQCFVLAGQFEGGGNPIARLYIYIYIYIYASHILYTLTQTYVSANC